MSHELLEPKTSPSTATHRLDVGNSNDTQCRNTRATDSRKRNLIFQVVTKYYPVIVRMQN